MSVVLVVVISLSLILVAGCGTNTTNTNTTEKSISLNGLTKESPIKVDKAANTVTYLAQVNGKFLNEPTRHGSVYVGGSNGAKSIFTGLVDAEKFYNSLIEAGFQPGNNMTFDNMEKTNVAGDTFDVTVTWDKAPKVYKLDEVVKDSNGKPIVIRFGGNLKNAQDKKTGCLICLDSCPVGIVSNSTYTYGAVEKRNEVGFIGNKEVLPPDGTPVAITFKKK
ncbi:MAG: hypothetical protein HPY50_18550 [Firmicutes bacterium]|nr:hypothetical protein [Bacillota bacterium]